MTFTLGAVAYDPKVVTIWGGFRAWFLERGFNFDYVLYSNYERQVEELLAGRVQAAWNSPLAWVRARRLAEASGRQVSAVAMRDTDRDLTSVIIARADGPIQSVVDLKGRVVGVGAVDSPQATLLPLAYMRSLGLEPEIRRFDVGVGLHGDHVGGEREAARALVGGGIDAACMIDGNHLQFVREGTLAPGSTRVVAQTPRFDHCNMTLAPDVPREEAEEFQSLLLGMSYADPDVRPLLDLEGLKEWCAGRTVG
jgi:phosphonate transport system substrate-binding protein